VPVAVTVAVTSEAAATDRRTAMLADPSASPTVDVALVNDRLGVPSLSVMVTVAVEAVEESVALSASDNVIVSASLPSLTLSSVI